MIQIAADPAITVLLTDLFLPGASGMQPAAEMSRTRPEEIAAEVVVLTSAVSPDPSPAAVRVFEFPRKPIRGRPLLLTLRGAHEAAVARRCAARDVRNSREAGTTTALSMPPSPTRIQT